MGDCPKKKCLQLIRSTARPPFEAAASRLDSNVITVTFSYPAHCYTFFFGFTSPLYVLCLVHILVLPISCLLPLQSQAHANNEFPNTDNPLALSPLDRDNPAAYKTWPQSSIRDSRSYLYYVPYTSIVYFQTCRSAARQPSTCILF